MNYYKFVWLRGKVAAGKGISAAEALESLGHDKAPDVRWKLISREEYVELKEREQ